MVRGYRIETGEIESQLKKHQEINEAVVLAKERKQGDQYLYAYIVFAADRELAADQLKKYLLKTLPDYMIPSYFISLEAIPLTPNGKVDRKALPDTRIEAGENFTAPRNEIELKLAEIWAEVLTIDGEIGIKDNFFELGGHSLKATILVSIIHSKMNVRVPLVELFKNPTIQQLAEYIKGTKKETLKAKDEHLVLLGEKSTKNNHLFFIHDGSGEVEGYLEFCKVLGDVLNCWGIRAQRLESCAPQNLSIQTLAAAYIEKIKKIQPHPPYHIAGWSFGGTVAFEMVKQLEQMKEEIRFFALFDCLAPQKDHVKNATEFTPESELHMIKNYFPAAGEIKKIIGNRKNLSQIWNKFMDYLEEINYSVEDIRNLIPNGMTQLIPNANQLDIKHLIYYLNIIRSLDCARSLYIPQGKIDTTVHYFGASQSKDIGKDQWDEYTNQPLKSFEIPGDHFSIFRKPAVLKMAEIFKRELLKVLRVN
jgi:thioesterase domain-containing protein/acyl carrier protein